MAMTLDQPQNRMLWNRHENPGSGSGNINHQLNKFMNTKLITALLGTTLLLGTEATIHAETFTIDFEDLDAPELFTDAQPIGIRYVFSHGVNFFSSFGSPGIQELGVGAHSGVNVAAWNSVLKLKDGSSANPKGQFIGFNPPADSVSFFMKQGGLPAFTINVGVIDGNGSYMVPITLTDQYQQFTFQGPGVDLLQFGFFPDAFNANPTSLTMDDLTFTRGSHSVPDSGSSRWLLATACGALGLLRHRSKS